jgi:hypothetical protein
MTETVAAGSPAKAFSLAHVPAWAWMGIWVYVVVLINGNLLLNDTDTYWHVATGNWILDHGALPRVDIYSFTKPGEAWISTAWLAQVLFAGAYRLAGWAGPVVLSAVSFAATFALLCYILSRRVPAAFVIMIAVAALLLSIEHALARPHLLALPVMLAWVYGLMSASERGEAPSFWLLPLIVLWTNLHGGFLLGLILVGAFALDAVWNARFSQPVSLGLRWAAFGVCALAATCVTPYGWESILASRKILQLGELLQLIAEWMPANFSSFSPFEGVILLSIAGALFWGVKLSPPRILLVLGLLHMALSHVRNFEIFALLMPLVVLKPIVEQFGVRTSGPARAGFPVASAVALAAAVGVLTGAVVAHREYTPRPAHSPAAAVDVLKRENAKRILNDLPFGGYLIARGMPVFLDGRSELYGEKFVMRYFRALQLKDVNQLLDILRDYDIDAVLLTPGTPAITLLDHLPGWQRVHADETSVVHARKAN